MTEKESLEFALRTSVTLVESLEDEHQDDEDLLESLASLKSLLIQQIERVVR